MDLSFDQIRQIIADVADFLADFVKKLQDALSKITVKFGYETTEASE